MENLKHTKGEWFVSDEGSNGIFITDLKQTGAIAKVYLQNSLVDISESKANAKLIASSKDLLEALIEVNNYWSKLTSLASCLYQSELNDIQKIIDDAIKKAII